MMRFTTTILKFGQQGEKTGWSYILIPHELAEELNPGVKKSYRVKGKIDSYSFDGMALLPMGNGDFILALKTDVRKVIKKRAGDQVQVQMCFQPKAYEIEPAFLECLKDEPEALQHFNSLTGSHRNYFSKWIESAKTETTKAKRIAMAVTALSRKWGYPEMIKGFKKT